MFIFLLEPNQAQASILSFVGNIFGSSTGGSSSQVLQMAATVESETEAASNTQKMPLLQAAINSDPNPSKGTTTLMIVGGGGGQALVSENGPIGSAADVKPQEDKESSDRISVYTVRKGDTLKGIADMYDVSQNTILWANNLKSQKDFKVGDALVILPVSGIKYIVKKGDTVKSIALASKGNEDDIISYNNLDDKASLSVGDEVFIPDAELSPSSPSSTSIATSSAATTKTKTKTSTKIVKTAPLIAASSSGDDSTSVDTSSSNSSSNSSSQSSSSGYFTRPIVGGIKTQGLHGHNGVDLASSYGTPILAAASGQVIIARTGGWNGGYGNYIVISHNNGMQTLYGHLSAVKVTLGQQVTKGQVIGAMGSTGESTGTHLHFEVRGGVNPF